MKIVQSEQGELSIFNNGTDKSADVSYYINPIHADYLHLDFAVHSPFDDAAFFTYLTERFGGGFQAGISSDSKVTIDILLRNGFAKKRVCTECECSVTDLAVPVAQTVTLTATKRGSSTYQKCTKLLYNKYVRTHENISPITYTYSEFCECIPFDMFVQLERNEILSWAFIEENEIAYIGTNDVAGFDVFCKTLCAKMFSEHESIVFEADDNDTDAQKLLSLFNPTDKATWDTYICD